MHKSFTNIKRNDVSRSRLWGKGTLINCIPLQFSIAENSVDGWLINYQQGEKCPGSRSRTWILFLTWCSVSSEENPGLIPGPSTEFSEVYMIEEKYFLTFSIVLLHPYVLLCISSLLFLKFNSVN